MSSPYQYTSQLHPSSSPYRNPYLQQPSPFIPDATLYPSSPHAFTPSTPRKVRFADGLLPEVPSRARRLSWPGVQTSDPVPDTGYSVLFSQPSDPSDFRARRHSFNAGTYSGWAPYPTPTQTYAPWLFPPQPPTFQLHPFLDGRFPRSDFWLDLSAPNYNPVRYINPGQVAQFTEEELRQPATHPPITRLRIICDYIPQWPIDLEHNPYKQGGLLLSNPTIPVSFGHILSSIHLSLRNRVSHIDWAKLSYSQETAIARAYHRRCKSVPSVAEYEASQGVRRVDYLLENIMFKGLIRTAGGEGFETMKLLVGPA